MIASSWSVWSCTIPDWPRSSRSAPRRSGPACSTAPSRSGSSLSRMPASPSTSTPCAASSTACCARRRLPTRRPRRLSSRLCARISQTVTAACREPSRSSWATAGRCARSSTSCSTRPSETAPSVESAPCWGPTSMATPAGSPSCWIRHASTRRCTSSGVRSRKDSRSSTTA